MAPALEALFIEDNDLVGKIKALKCVYLWGKSLKICLSDSPSSGRRTWYNGASSCLDGENNTVGEITEIAQRLCQRSLCDSSRYR